MISAKEGIYAILRSGRFMASVRLAGIASLLLVLSMIVVQQSGRITHLTLDLDPPKIVHAENHSYTSALDAVRPPFPGLRLFSDSSSHPARSKLELFEDGTEVGSAHSRHADIAGLGQGRYSHWGRILVFSTPDNSDPRTNGHSYQIKASFGFPAWMLTSLVILGLLAVVVPLVSPAAKSRSGSITSTDIACALGLLILAGLETWLLLVANGHPAIVASSDGGNISAWVAGRLHPERFAADFLLADPSNTSFYISLFLTSVLLLGEYLGDIGRAYLSLNFPIVALQLLGFYFLGRLLTGSHFASVVLALLVNVPVLVWGYNDFLGTYFVPLPRTAYDAILPFLMISFIAFGGRARNIPFLFVLCGLSFYIHPVSAPGVSAGLLLASLALKPTEESFGRRTIFLFVGGPVFLACAFPFAQSFLASYSGGLKVASDTLSPDMAAALEAFRQRNGALFYDALLAFRMLLGEMEKTWPVWMIGLLGLFFVPRVDPAKVRICRFLLLFLAGCLLGSVGVCLIDQTVAGYLGRPPFQLDLIRGLRFALAPLLLGFVLVLAEVEGAIRRRWKPLAANGVAAVAAISIVYAWWSAYPNRLGAILGLKAIPQWAETVDPDANTMMRYLRTKSVDGTILPIGDATVGLAVRYAGLQPIAFLPNDSNALFYSGSDLRVEWLGLNKLYTSLHDAAPEAFDNFQQLWMQSKARYVLLETSVLDPSLEEKILKMSDVTMRSGKWALLRPFAISQDNIGR
jgi:hypothetical protein